MKLPFSLVAPALQPIDVRDSVHLVAPVLEQPPTSHQPILTQKKLSTPIPARAPKLAVRLPEEKMPAIQPPKQEIEVAKVSPNPSAPVAKTDKFRSPELLPGTKVPHPVVSANFGGSSAPVTENKPARQVQTGGFGDPNGLPVSSSSAGKGAMIAKLGSFDLPEGSGSGNGTGDAKGTRGTVASAGFGNGVALPGQNGSGGNSGQRKVQTTSFGSAEPPSTDAPKRQQVTSTASKDTPVLLLSKPTPRYTSEARQRRIEGDVELDVEFMATGQVHVLRVLQGLGYGLDETAVTAAEQIHFNPARHDGQPVDSHGRLRIVFRLS
jgi:TonB family protein